MPTLTAPIQTEREGRTSTGGLYLLEDCFRPANTRRFFDPIATLTAHGRDLCITNSAGVRTRHAGDPFHWLCRHLRTNPDQTAVGYWGYDLRHHTERLSAKAQDHLHLPDMHVALFESQRSARRSEPGSELRDAYYVTSVDRERTAEAAVSRAEYLQAIRKVKDYIAAGDCYQVNLSQRFSAPWSGAPWELYQRLREASPAPYAAYLDCGDHQILSSSPELFLKIRDGIVETRPIKGTRPRGATPTEDAALAQELLHSEKDRAELVMIVDLERNDLGRVCEFGSVRVPELMRLETYANVHHLVSTVRGKLRPEVGPLDCLRAAFPGGSITGAPKIRAMEIIDELEPCRRGVYTGAIGWVDGRGNAEWSIAIRTMTLKDGRAHFHVGSGIVADSDPEAEYEETLTKASGMLKALGATL